MDIKEYKAAKNNLTESHHPWEHARVSFMHKLFKKNIGHLKIKNILDIGCGDIFFLKSFAKRYPLANYYGIDIAFDDDLINKYKLQKGAEKLNLLKSSESFAKLNKKADVIFLLDVIEHIKNDYEFLSSLSKSTFIHSDTFIFISVPAFQNLFVSRDKWLGHYRRYSLNLLKSTVTKSGFKVVGAQYLFFSLLFPRILTKIKEQAFKPDLDKMSGIGGWKKRKIIDGLIKKILLLDFFIINLFLKFNIILPGLSCFVICKKQQ